MAGRGLLSGGGRALAFFLMALLALEGCGAQDVPLGVEGFIPSNRVYRSPPLGAGWVSREPFFASTLDVIYQYRDFSIFVSSGSQNRTLVFNTLRDEDVEVALEDDIGLVEAFLKREAGKSGRTVRGFPEEQLEPRPITLDGQEGRYLSTGGSEEMWLVAAVALPEYLVLFAYEVQQSVPEEVRVATLLDFQALLKEVQLYP